MLERPTSGTEGNLSVCIIVFLQVFNQVQLRTQRKRVLVKRKEAKGFEYACAMLDAMVKRRESTTLSAAAAAPQAKGYVNPGGTPTEAEKDLLLAQRAAHSRF